MNLLCDPDLRPLLLNESSKAGTRFEEPVVKTDGVFGSHLWFSIRKSCDHQETSSTCSDAQSRDRFPGPEPYPPSSRTRGQGSRRLFRERSRGYGTGCS